MALSYLGLNIPWEDPTKSWRSRDPSLTPAVTLGLIHRNSQKCSQGPLPEISIRILLWHKNFSGVKFLISCSAEVNWPIHRSGINNGVRNWNWLKWKSDSSPVINAVWRYLVVHSQTEGRGIVSLGSMTVNNKMNVQEVIYVQDYEEDKITRFTRTCFSLGLIFNLMASGSQITHFLSRIFDCATNNQKWLFTALNLFNRYFLITKRKCHKTNS